MAWRMVAGIAGRNEQEVMADFMTERRSESSMGIAMVVRKSTTLTMVSWRESEATFWWHGSAGRW